MDVYIPGDVYAPWDVTSVVFSLGLDLGCYCRNVPVIPNCVCAAYRKLCVVRSNAHRFGEGSEVCIQSFSVLTYENHFASLVCGDDEAYAKAPENIGQIA